MWKVGMPFSIWRVLVVSHEVVYSLLPCLVTLLTDLSLLDTTDGLDLYISVSIGRNGAVPNMAYQTHLI